MGVQATPDDRVSANRHIPGPSVIHKPDPSTAADGGAAPAVTADQADGMTSTINVPGLRIGDPSSLVTVVPFLLGYQPETSLVLLAMGDRNRVGLAARLDLPGGLPRSGVDAVREGAAQLGRAAARSSGHSAVAILYFPAPIEIVDRRWRRVAAAVVGGIGAAGLKPLDVIAVGDRRWWSLLCESSDCCSPNGTDLPPPGTTAVEAAAVAAGLVVRGSRADVASLIAPGDPRRRAEVAAQLDRLTAAEGAAPHPAAGLVAVEAAIGRRSGPIPAPLAAAAIRAVADVRVRDAVLVAESHDALAGALQRWTELVRLAPDDRCAPVATLLAATAYQLGDGTLAGLALEHALGTDPDYYLASLLAGSLGAGVPPDRLFDSLAEASREARASVRETARSGHPIHRPEESARVGAVPEGAVQDEADGW